MEFFETSAKTGSNVEDVLFYFFLNIIQAYLCIARQCKNRLMSSDVTSTGGGTTANQVVVDNNTTTNEGGKKSGCC